MQLAELRTFLAIIETGSLVRASEQLNVTQSTVTARLKSLETELGQSLINRQKSGATLTAAGLKLHRYATTISELWQQARAETALPDGLSSVCNLGCHTDLWQSLGERIFNYVSSSETNVAFSVSTGGQSDLAIWLNDGLTDMSLTYWPSVRQNQQIVTTFVDRLVLVSTNANTPIKFDPGYVYVEAGEEFDREHAAAYSDAGIARISFNTAQMAVEYLLTKGGSAYLPERIARDYIKSKQLYELNAPVFSRTSYLLVNTSVGDSWPWLDDCVAQLPKSLITT